MGAYILLAVLVLVYLQSSGAFLVVKGPTEPVLEGEDVTLECADTEFEMNISSVHFERLSKYMHTWYRLEADQETFYRRCFLYDVDVRRKDGKLFVNIPNIQSFSDGPYRCVSEDPSRADNASEPLTIPVHYMRELSVHKTGLNYAYRYYNYQDLRVRLGDNLELECSTSASEAPEYFWAKEGEDKILPSNKLKLKQITKQDEGRYTCSAHSPTVRSLNKKRTISITVLPENAAWYESTSGHFALMASAAVLLIVVVVVSVTAYLCRRVSLKENKGPIDDRSQKKPIYKSSAESLTSSSSDKQPLV